MKPEQIIGFLTAIREQQVAVVAQAEAQIVQIDALVATLATEDRPRCPHCKSDQLIKADEGFVCDSCAKSFTFEATP